jgi:hypothetical protein
MNKVMRRVFEYTREETTKEAGENCIMRNLGI